MEWVKEKERLLIKRYPTDISLDELGKQLGKSVKSVKHKAARLGLSRKKVPINKPKEEGYRKRIEREYYRRNRKRIYRRKEKRLKERKINLVNLLGGKCSRCGYKKCISALEFHHKRNGKEGNIDSIIKNYSKEKALKEAKKCILICANCHRELHHSKGP